MRESTPGTAAPALQVSVARIFLVIFFFFFPFPPHFSSASGDTIGLIQEKFAS
jgi:hypothetical protein